MFISMFDVHSFVNSRKRIFELNSNKIPHWNLHTMCQTFHDNSYKHMNDQSLSVFIQETLTLPLTVIKNLSVKVKLVFNFKHKNTDMHKIWFNLPFLWKKCTAHRRHKDQATTTEYSWHIYEASQPNSVKLYSTWQQTVWYFNTAR